MCRLVGYLGDDIQVSSLITDSDQSLTRQATDSSVQNFMKLLAQVLRHGKMVRFMKTTHILINLSNFQCTIEL
ncbi:MAG: hypothetical protein Ct9H90mP7_5740 [Candidatus Neomarinimicrobiota bacterium]|nr:MAG: hypothetical protein Ct9H90mP7_5740 [Candidatus Neomarinimicrobiota bacterium]